jgi:hypothetical protein
LGSLETWYTPGGRRRTGRLVRDGRESTEGGWWLCTERWSSCTFAAYRFGIPVGNMDRSSMTHGRIRRQSYSREPYVPGIPGSCLPRYSRTSFTVPVSHHGFHISRQAYRYSTKLVRQDDGRQKKLDASVYLHRPANRLSELTHPRGEHGLSRCIRHVRRHRQPEDDPR